MKKYMVVVFTLFFISASAQMTKDDVNLIQAIYGKDKRDIMQAYMHFNDAASEKSFWKMYDAYEAERKKIGQDYIKILQSYADNYDKLDNKKADELTNRALANNLAFENLYTQYYKKMKPVIGALKASQFLQLEMYLRNVVKLKVLDDIPFIGQIDRTKVTTQ